MDVHVDGDLIRSRREQRAWSQEHLAGAAGIGVRTIQRIEATGVASYESVRAISAALEMPVNELRAESRETPSAAEPVSSQAGSLAASPEPRRPLSARVQFALGWLGAGLALAILAGTSGFWLLRDYQKVRVLRAFEQWVTAEAEPTAANRSDGR